MKRTALAATLIISLIASILSSCSTADTGQPSASITDPSATISTGSVTTASEPEQTSATNGTSAALSVHELRGLIARYKSEGDHAAVYETALKLIAIEPSDSAAYIDAVSALAALAAQNYDEINRLMEQGSADTAIAQALAEWAAQNQPDHSILVPFAPDTTDPEDINVVGITTGNLTNAAKYHGDWHGGLLTWQGDWVYLSRPDEDYAIYKIHANGESYQAVGQAHGTSLNVIGDWIYFIDPFDEYRSYKMRTDGSLLQKLSDDSSQFLTVSGEWIVYHNGSDDGCLYKVKTDGSQKEKLTDRTVMFASVADGWAYYCEKRENSGLMRIPINGGEPDVVIETGVQNYRLGDQTVNLSTGFIQTYCVWDDWVYFMDMNNPYSVRRVHTDGTGYELVWPFDFRITTFNIADGNLSCSFNLTYEEDGFFIGDEIVVVDLETLEKKYHLDADTEPICVGPDGWFYYLKYNDGLAWYAVKAGEQEYRIG
ncbi:MAG: DUF5050 domain-containing protein [Bacillota bacterium]|nr:DUF5050 domain-containing protein [Bacillota bacterium]